MITFSLVFGCSFILQAMQYFSSRKFHHGPVHRQLHFIMKTSEICSRLSGKCFHVYTVRANVLVRVFSVPRTRTSCDWDQIENHFRIWKRFWLIYIRSIQGKIFGLFTTDAYILIITSSLFNSDDSKNIIFWIWFAIIYQEYVICYLLL